MDNNVVHNQHHNKEEFIKRKKSKKVRHKLQILILIAVCVISFSVNASHENSLAENNKQLDKSGDINLSEPTSNSDKWNLILVNPWNSIPENYDISLMQLKNGQSVDERIYPDLQKMMDDCRVQGLSPLICSSYRTNEVQNGLFNKQVQKYLSRGYTKEDANSEAAKWVAVPGTSEHQLGLALDIVAESNQILDASQETAEQKWLINNSYKYGFILRYPSDKSNITGISYEPWHYRYVGKEVAAKITEKGICLEEYLED